jgi:8-amino-7-oxononanoate synthase
MATVGKALGGYGAFACGEATVVEWLLQRARTYMFSTALPPACAAVASAALGLLEGADSPVPRLHQRIARWRAACAQRGIPLADSATAIQPVVLGEAARALAVSERLLERGMVVPAIRPPTVPANTSRLRISVSAAHTAEDIDALAAALGQSLAS